MFLLLMGFFFLPITACNECERGLCYPGTFEDVRSVEIGNNSYSLVSFDYAYRAQEFEDGYVECSLQQFFPTKDDFDCAEIYVIETRLSTDYYPRIKRRVYEYAWLSYIDKILQQNPGIASSISNINGDPNDFAVLVAEGTELQAVIHKGNKECHVLTPTDESFYLGGEPLYNIIANLKKLSSK